jgi:glycosyltransferase involved in cell wall biosynthesis
MSSFHFPDAEHCPQICVTYDMWYNINMNGKGCQSLDTGQQPMNIGLNAHLLSLAPTYRGAGINWYIYNLLLNLALADQENQYTVFLGDRRFPPNSGLTLRTSWLPTTHPLVRIGWEQWIQPFVLWQEKIELLHSLAFVTPLLSPCPSVITIYDLSFLTFPRGFRGSKRLYLTLLTRPSARKARRVITISESTKRDTVRLLGVSSEKVDVVYCGVDRAFHPLPEKEVASFRQKCSLPERIILFVGTIEPRKNVARLIEAYSRLRDRQVKLVIGGARGWLYEEVFARVEELDLTDDVLFPGYISADELPLWYNAAELFVYPSLYEGFGLPPLEAMACGTPVITSNVSSLPEVVGEAGLTVDPTDSRGLAEAMNQVLGDRALRQSMRERGLTRAGRFSWAKAARETIAVYRRALGR